MMNWAQLLQIEWAHPWGGLLVAQPALMALLLKLRRNQVLHYADVHLLAWAVRGNAHIQHDKWRSVLNLIAWLLLACALAGPRLPLLDDQAHQQAMQGHQLDIMVLLDVSPSMLAQDISPQRLQRAKLELLDLIPRLHGERLGLIAFSGSAGLIMPMNRDEAALRYYLNIADPSLFDTPGTALSSALELALRSMSQKNDTGNSGERFLPRAILLLTDAEITALSGLAGSAAWDAAARLKQEGVPLYILGMGTEQGSTITQADGNTLVNEGADVVSMMDTAGFADLAAKTGGKFVKVSDGDSDWQALYEHGLLAVPGGKPTNENVQAWLELYAFCLLPALLLLVLSNTYFLFNAIKYLNLSFVAGILLVLTLTDMPDAHAAESAAYAAYRSKNHARAQTLYGELSGYAARMGEGAAAYRRKDFPYAVKQFSNALLEAHGTRQREQALFNLGNSYFMAENYHAAADAFLGVMHYLPNNRNDEIRQNARANLALAAGRLAENNKLKKKSNGILGRRGRETGGAAGDDASDQPLSMDSSDDKKEKTPAVGSELFDAEQARLRTNGVVASKQASAEIDHDMAYRAALKKLELTEDHPLVLHKALLRIEAAREYVPQPEMPPW